MKTDISEMSSCLKGMLKSHAPLIKIVADEADKFEVAGTVETMQGKKKVDGIYFSSVVPKPKDVRLYFFPVYTHADDFKDMPAPLRKCLKGKSCFHIKKMDADLENDIAAMIKKGVELYQRDGMM